MTDAFSFHDLVPLRPRDIDGATVQTANARQLHAALETGRDYSTWIKGRIERFGFVDGQDFVTESRSPDSGSGNRGAALEYHITADMAKELSMVENNDRGRSARRYFIAMEQASREMLSSSGITPKVLGGIVKGIVHRELEDAIHRRLPSIVAEAIAADARVAAVHYVPALKVAIDRGVPQRGRRKIVSRIGNRLVAHCQRNGLLVLRDLRNVRLFPQEAIEPWLKAEGGLMISTHLSAVLGQGVLPFKRRTP